MQQAPAIQADSAVNHRRYLIIGYQRSGTTAMHLILTGHPRVAAFHGELREPFFSRGLAAFNAGYLTDAEQAAGHGLLFDALTGAHVDSTTTHRGAKTVCNSKAAARVIVETVRERLPDLAIVIIERRDLVAQFGSRAMTHRSGVFHSWQKPDTKAVPAIGLNRFEFERYATVVGETYAELARLAESQPYLKVFHEDFLADPEGLYAKVTDFLGLPPLAPDWFESKKVLPDPASYIRNYDALTAILQRVRSEQATGTMNPHRARALKLWTALRKRLGPRRSWG